MTDKNAIEHLVAAATYYNLAYPEQDVELFVETVLNAIEKEVIETLKDRGVIK